MTKGEARRALRRARRAHVARIGPDGALADAIGLARHAAIVAAARCVAGYVAVRDELDCSALASALARTCGCATALPRVEGDFMIFRLHRQGDPLEPGLAGIPQPAADAPAAEPDLVLVPLVGVDLSGNRLGQGAGYYDRALAASGARTIGIAWDVQVVDRLDPDPWDRPLDAIATPTRWIATPRWRP